MGMTSGSVLSQLGSSLIHMTLVVKVLISAAVIGFILSTIWPSFAVWLSLSPTELFPPHFCLWTPLTYWLVEVNFGALMVDIASLHLLSTLSSPVWSTVEQLRFSAVCTGVPAGVASVALLIFHSTVGGADGVERLLHLRLTGLWALVGAVTVAVKQLLPADQILITTPLGRLKTSHLPPVLILSVGVAGVIGVIDPVSHALLYLIGSLVGWIYLRFYQPHPNGSRGDAGEHLSFASFFPSLLQPAVSSVSNGVFLLLIRLRCCKPPVVRRFQPVDITAQSALFPDTQDAERRRQKALRDLNERLKVSSSLTAWPNLIGPDSHQPANQQSTVEIPSSQPHSTAVNLETPPPADTPTNEKPTDT